MRDFDVTHGPFYLKCFSGCLLSSSPDGGDKVDEPGLHVDVGRGGSGPGPGELEGGLAEAVDGGRVLHGGLLHPGRHLLQEDAHHGQAVGLVVAHGVRDVVVRLVVVHQVQLAVVPEGRGSKGSSLSYTNC